MFRQRKSVLTHTELQRRDGNSLPLHDLVMQTESDREEKVEMARKRGCVSCKRYPAGVAAGMHRRGNEEPSGSADPSDHRKRFRCERAQDIQALSEETGVMTRASGIRCRPPSICPSRDIWSAERARTARWVHSREAQHVL